MRVVHSEQFNIPCVVPDAGESADEVIEACLDQGALLDTDPDGREFCIQFRDDVGPELWTESAVRRTKHLRAPRF